MSNCDRYGELIEAVADGLATENERAELLAHTDECASCRLRMLSLELITKEAPSLMCDAPEGFARSVIEKIEAGVTVEPRRRRFIGPFTVAAAAVASVVLLYVGALGGFPVFDGASGGAVTMDAAGSAAQNAYGLSDGAGSAELVPEDENGTDTARDAGGAEIMLMGIAEAQPEGDAAAEEKEDVTTYQIAPRAQPSESPADIAGSVNTAAGAGGIVLPYDITFAFTLNLDAGPELAEAALAAYDREHFDESGYSCYFIPIEDLASLTAGLDAEGIGYTLIPTENAPPDAVIGVAVVLH